MKKPKKSEKLLLKEIFRSAKNLQRIQGEIAIGQLISLIRFQLRISQRLLAKKSKVPQSTISRIEAGALNPTILTLDKIFNALSCKLIFSAFPYENLETIRKRQARKKAEKKINYLIGTMALEKQKPDQKLIKELIEEEEKKLLNSKSDDLWEE